LGGRLIGLYLEVNGFNEYKEGIYFGCDDITVEQLDKWGTGERIG
jgi:hypothetical protein